MIFKTIDNLRIDPPMTNDEALTDSMSLDEILYRKSKDIE